MGGGLIQLYALGKQDIHLIGNPQITFFKQIYKKYTNFGIEQVKQEFIGSFELGQRIRCKIQRKGDLLSNMYIVFDINKSKCFQNVPIKKLGFKLIEYIEIEIGGQLIDKHYGEWLDIWTQLTSSYEEYQMTKIMMNEKDSNKINFFNNDPGKLYVPLCFWFNKDPGLALPLLSLQYHEVNIYLKLRKFSEIFYFPLNDNGNPKKVTHINNISCNSETECGSGDFFDITKSSGSGCSNCYDNINYVKSDDNNTWAKISINNNDIEFEDIYLLCDYIFLDVDERKLFINKPLQYLITQTQTTEKLFLSDPQCDSDLNKKSSNTEISLDFNYPVKEIIWCVYPSFFDNSYIYKNMDLSNTLFKSELFINNKSTNNITDYKYYSVVQPYQHHPCGGLVNPTQSLNLNGGFYTYSFSLDPEIKQPNGTLNFSKINDFNINFTYQNSSIYYTKILQPFIFLGFGVNYNILKIDEGMGKLQYY